jgi:hypothetical protein
LHDARTICTSTSIPAIHYRVGKRYLQLSLSLSLSLNFQGFSKASLIEKNQNGLTKSRLIRNLKMSTQFKYEIQKKPVIN